MGVLQLACDSWVVMLGGVSGGVRLGVREGVGMSGHTTPGVLVREGTLRLLLGEGVGVQIGVKGSFVVAQHAESRSRLVSSSQDINVFSAISLWLSLLS